MLMVDCFMFSVVWVGVMLFVLIMVRNMWISCRLRLEGCFSMVVNILIEIDV